MKFKNQLMSAALAVGLAFGAAAAADAASDLTYASPVTASYYAGIFNFPDTFNFVNYVDTGTDITFGVAPFATDIIPSIHETADIGGYNSDPSWPGAFNVYAADFTTTINAGHTAKYGIGFGTDDAGYLFIDGNLVAGLPGAHGYTYAVYNTVLTAGVHTLEVKYDNSFCCGAVANLALGVPEPATWALMLAGFGGLGFALRSARRGLAAIG